MRYLVCSWCVVNVSIIWSERELFYGREILERYSRNYDDKIYYFEYGFCLNYWGVWYFIDDKGEKIYVRVFYDI